MPRRDLERSENLIPMVPGVRLEDVYGQWVGDDRERSMICEAVREFVPDAIDLTYMELKGRLD